MFQTNGRNLDLPHGIWGNVKLATAKSAAAAADPAAAEAAATHLSATAASNPAAANPTDAAAAEILRRVSVPSRKPPAE